MNNIASGDYPFLNSIIGNNNGNTARFIAFYKTNSGLGLSISSSYGSYVTVANDDSGFSLSDYKFPSSKSNCTILNKWHVISITWSNRKSNCWPNDEKIMTFNAGNAKGTDHCIIGDIGKTIIKSHLIGCIREIIGFYRSLTDKETLYIHKYFGCIIGDHLFALGFNLSCGVTSSRGLMSGNFEQTITAQLCILAISPKVVCNFVNLGVQSRMQFCFQGPLYYPKLYAFL